MRLFSFVSLCVVALFANSLAHAVQWLSASGSCSHEVSSAPIVSRLNEIDEGQGAQWKMTGIADSRSRKERAILASVRRYPEYFAKFGMSVEDGALLYYDVIGTNRRIRRLMDDGDPDSPALLLLRHDSRFTDPESFASFWAKQFAVRSRFGFGHIHDVCAHSAGVFNLSKAFVRSSSFRTKLLLNLERSSKLRLRGDAWRLVQSLYTRELGLYEKITIAFGLLLAFDELQELDDKAFTARNEEEDVAIVRWLNAGTFQNLLSEDQKTQLKEILSGVEEPPHVSISDELENLRKRYQYLQRYRVRESELAAG